MISGISSTAIPMTSSNGGGPAVSGAPNPAATTAPIANTNLGSAAVLQHVLSRFFIGTS